MEEEFTLESLGQHLREQREKSGLTRRDIASQTRIPIDQIAHLEDGRLSSLPPVYAKGFLRSYAMALSLDAESLLTDFRRITGQTKTDSVKALTNKYVETKITEDSDFSLGRVFVFLILIVAILAGFYFLNPSFRNFVSNYLPFKNEQVETAEIINHDNSQAPIIASQPVGQVVIEDAHGKLVVRAEKSTWAQVVVDGEQQQFVALEPGQNQSWEGQHNIKITTGDGRALKAEWNGKELGFLGPEGALELVFPAAASNR